MARPSNRSRVLDATLAVAARAGVRAVTFEAVAAQAEMTKAGVLYHFPSREELLAGVAEHVVARWEVAAQTYLRAPFEESDLAERVGAFVRSMCDRAAGAELRLLVDQVWDDGFDQHWIGVSRRWTQAPGERLTVDQRVVLLAAEGLWMNDLTDEFEQTPTEREAVVARLYDLLSASRA